MTIRLENSIVNKYVVTKRYMVSMPLSLAI